MKCAKKPLSQKGVYLIVRDRIAEGVLTKQFATRDQTPPLSMVRKADINIWMKCAKEPPEQTGVYLLYMTVCEGGSDKAIRQIVMSAF